MQILAITPISVDEQELARRQARYDKLSPRGTRVHLENLGSASQVPHALETTEDIEASEAALVERFAGVDAEPYDAFLPDCVLDPVMDHADRMARPVHGIGRLSGHYLAGLGLATGAVARNAAIAAELDRKLRSYGLAPMRPTAVVDLSVEDIADDATWAAAVGPVIAGLDCQAVINACSAVDLTQDSNGPLLLDPTATALRMISALGEVAR